MRVRVECFYKRISVNKSVEVGKIVKRQLDERQRRIIGEVIDKLVPEINKKLNNDEMEVGLLAI